MKGLLDLDFWRVLQMQDCQNVLSASRHKLITLTTHASAVVWLECRSRFFERKTFLEKTCFFSQKRKGLQERHVQVGWANHFAEENFGFGIADFQF